MNKDFNILAVDLDETLVKSDMLLETFWSAFSQDLLIPFKSLLALTKGKANLKSFLYNNSSVNIESLPYNQIVIDYIKSHRQNGGEVALVTGSDQRLAYEISDYLGFFNKVYGTSDIKNLVGSNKGKFQKGIFGFKNFDYLGNSFEDIPCWEYANRAITLNAKKNLKRSCEKVNNNYLHLQNLDNQNLFFNFFRAIRTYQWIKNILVFIPLIAARTFDPNLIFESVLAFFAFSCVASSVYIFNDLLDLDADRNHPKKCNRPFASGSLSLLDGSIGGFVMLVLGFTLAYSIGLSFLFLITTYYASTICYSLFLKQKPLFDIFLLSGLYTIRILGGGVATNLEISFWLLAFSIFFFLSLASVKRETELVELKKRDVISIPGRGYIVSDLNFLNIISISSSLISSLILALYINSPKVLDLYTNPHLLWISCCLFLFWNLRLHFKTYKGQMEDDPIVFIIKDNFSKIIFMGIIILVFFA